MSTVAEVENALRGMPLPNARSVTAWLREYLDDQWDKQMDADIAAGRVKPRDEIINDQWLTSLALTPRRRSVNLTAWAKSSSPSNSPITAIWWFSA